MIAPTRHGAMSARSSATASAVPTTPARLQSSSRTSATEVSASLRLIFCSQISGGGFIYNLRTIGLFICQCCHSKCYSDSSFHKPLQLSRLRACGTMLPVLPSTAPSQSPLAATSCPLLATTMTKFSTRLPVCPPRRFLRWSPSVMRPCLCTARPTLRPSDRPWRRLLTRHWQRPSPFRLRSFR